MFESATDLRLGKGAVRRRVSCQLELPAGPAAGEVAEILVMFSCIERWVSQLDANDAAMLAGYPDRLFRGFRLRGESAHLKAATALIGGSGFFDEFAGRELRSPVPMLERYRPLLARFEAERQAGMSGAGRNLDQLRRLLALH